MTDTSKIPERVSRVAGDDGYDLHYRVWEADAPRATLVVLHGIMSHGAWIRPCAQPLARMGYAVIAVDRRGSGLNIASRGDAPSADALVRDVWQVIERERREDTPVFLVGWCWGAVLAIHALAHRPGTLAGLILLAPGIFPSATVKNAASAEAPRGAPSASHRPSVRTPVREEMFTRGDALHSFILRDEQRVRWVSPRFHDIVQRMTMFAATRLRRIDVPTLVVLAQQDVATDNERTRAAFENVRQAPITIDSLDGPHGMQFEVPDALAARIARWLEPCDVLTSRSPSGGGR